MARRTVLLPQRTEPLTEKQFMAQVVDLAKLCGWEHYHAWLSIHSPQGWPDLALIKPPRLVYAELKREGGKLTPAQGFWIDLLRRCGCEVYVWRPADIDQIKHVLTGR